MAELYPRSQSHAAKPSRWGARVPARSFSLDERVVKYVSTPQQRPRNRVRFATEKLAG